MGAGVEVPLRAESSEPSEAQHPGPNDEPLHPVPPPAGELRASRRKVHLLPRCAQCNSMHFVHAETGLCAHCDTIRLKRDGTMTTATSTVNVDAARAASAEESNHTPAASAGGGGEGGGGGAAAGAAGADKEEGSLVPGTAAIAPPDERRHSFGWLFDCVCGVSFSQRDRYQGAWKSMHHLAASLAQEPDTGVPGGEGERERWLAHCERCDACLHACCDLEYNPTMTVTLCAHCSPEPPAQRKAPLLTRPAPPADTTGSLCGGACVICRAPGAFGTRSCLFRPDGAYVQQQVLVARSRAAPLRTAADVRAAVSGMAAIGTAPSDDNNNNSRTKAERVYMRLARGGTAALRGVVHAVRGTRGGLSARVHLDNGLLVWLDEPELLACMFPTSGGYSFGDAPSKQKCRLPAKQAAELSESRASWLGVLFKSFATGGTGDARLRVSPVTKPVFSTPGVLENVQQLGVFAVADEPAAAAVGATEDEQSAHARRSIAGDDGAIGAEESMRAHPSYHDPDAKAMPLQRGDVIEACDRDGEWYTACVIGVAGGRALIHFFGWDKMCARACTVPS